MYINPQQFDAAYRPREFTFPPDGATPPGTGKFDLPWVTALNEFKAGTPFVEPHPGGAIVTTRARRSADRNPDYTETIGLSRDLLDGIKRSIFPLNQLRKSKRKLKERLEQEKSDLQIKLAALALTVKLANVERVEIKGYALGMKELGVVVAEKAKTILAAKLGIDEGRIHVEGGGSSQPVIGIKIDIYS